LTPAEYVQLKAFARVDGAQVALLWTASFACYLVGLKAPLLGMAAILLMIITPFFVARRLRRFRDVDRGGIISLMRGWAFVILVFFYGGVLLALVQFVYFAYLDQGYVLQTLHDVLSSPESRASLEQMGMTQTVSDSLQMLSELRPIDYALNQLTLNISLGILLGLPIAALLKKGNRVGQM